MKPDSIENYIKEYPNQEQVKMMKTWLKKHEPGTFHFTGLVNPTDDTVVTPQATVDYGYNWFSLSEGTAGNLFVPNPAGTDSRLLNTFHVTGERLALGGVMAGSAIVWIREILGKHVDFDLLEEEAERVNPGADGLTFLPYLLGERTPVWDPSARGVLLGLSLNHKRGHIYRAILEGGCYGFRQIQEIIQENGDIIQEVVAIDGGAKSALWRQIFSDVLQVPLRWYPAHGGTSLIAAFLAAKAVGHFNDFSGINTWLGASETNYPDKSLDSIYHRKYEIYKQIYPLYKNCFGDTG